MKTASRGFTLVELMVALLLGLLLLAGVLTILLGNRANFDAQRASAHLQENARLAEFVLSHAIAHAGYRTLDANTSAAFAATAGRAANYPEGAAVTGKRGAARRGDLLRVRFLARGDVRDCLGGRVGAPGHTGRTDFEFFVNSGRSLECRKIKAGGSTTTWPIVENAERLRVRYGLDTNGDRAVDRYVATLSGKQATKIRSVRFQLLLRSADDVPALPRAHRQSYTFFDGSTFTANDRRARILVDRTVALRNP